MKTSGYDFETLEGGDTTIFIARDNGGDARLPEVPIPQAKLGLVCRACKLVPSRGPDTKPRQRPIDIH